MGVSKMRVRIVITRMPEARRSRAIGSVIPTTPPSTRCGPPAPLPVESRDRRRVNDHAPLAGPLGSLLDMAAAATEIMLNVPIRLTLITRENDSGVRPFFPRSARRSAFPRGADQTMRSAQISPKGRFDRALGRGPVGDVGLDEADLGSEFGPSEHSLGPFCTSAITARPPPATDRRTQAAPSPDPPPVTKKRVVRDLHAAVGEGPDDD